MLDTSIYEIEFQDGRSDGYTDNVISENMYAKCGAKGRQSNLMKGIIDHKKDDHVFECADIYIKHGSNKQVRKTTKGWHLCVEWKDGITSWERLSDLKEINPIKVAEYAVYNNLFDAPAFVWWDPHVLKRGRSIIDAVKILTIIVLTSLAKSSDDCVRLDKENDNTLW
jgi:hypothetical protein